MSNQAECHLCGGSGIYSADEGTSSFCTCAWGEAAARMYQPPMTQQNSAHHWTSSEKYSAANANGAPPYEQPQPSAEGEWHRYVDEYSEHYEVTNTDRDQACIGNGHLFAMGDKDSANELVDYLNEAEAYKTLAVKLGEALEHVITAADREYKDQEHPPEMDILMIHVNDVRPVLISLSSRLRDQLKNLRGDG